MAHEFDTSAPDRRAFLGSAASVGAAALLGGFGVPPALAAEIATETERSGKPLKAAFSNAGLQATWCAQGKRAAEYFGRLFNISSFNLTANATAAHRPRDLALILDFSGSMKYGSESAYYLLGGGDTAGSLNPDAVYPKFGHYYAISQRALGSSSTAQNSYRE